MDDIPEALREQTRPKKSFSPAQKQSHRKSPAFKPRFFLLLIPIPLILGTIVSFWFRPSNNATTNAETTIKETPSQTPSQTPNRTLNRTLNQSSSNSPSTSENNVDSVLGHLKYEEAPASELKAIVADGSIKMRIAAANKFLEMQAAARREGINIYSISGFRTVSQQNELFFKIKEQRGQEASKRAEVSAPPGYSEHHTGYAVDIGDANNPSTNLNTSFAKTAAFRWLKENAPHYSFEISFPKDNPQGVSYEPWHWRFVGDIHSLETFYKARNLDKSRSNEP
jgi:zinc D-Ala-D-Ala carboxypeptidase